jgi:hypothetical protein
MRTGKADDDGGHERKGSIDPAGVLATACARRRSDATREAPGGNPRYGIKLATRER